MTENLLILTSASPVVDIDCNRRRYDLYCIGFPPPQDRKKTQFHHINFTTHVVKPSEAEISLYRGTQSNIKAVLLFYKAFVCATHSRRCTVTGTVPEEIYH